MDASTDSRMRYRAIAALLIIGSAILRIAYLAHDCPLDLSPDEAHYWDWSRHSDWSYYSKGPVVALLIQWSCAIFGPWAEATTGSLMPAVRLPAVICGALLLTSLYVLAVQTLKRESWACAVVALALTLPPMAAGSFLMTIDAPFTACWGWACVVGYEAAVRQRRWAWPVLGVIVGIGILAKYTMALFIPSLGLYLLIDRERRQQLFQPGFWLMSVIAGLFCIPVLIWNSQHGWVTFHHVGWQAGVRQRTGWLWLGPIAFVGGQFALLIGYWFIAWVAGMWTELRTRWSDPDRAYLWWLSAPTFGVFLIASLKTTGQLNWAVTAYLSGMILATAWLLERWHRPTVRLGVASAVVLGLCLIGAVHFPAAARPVLLTISGPPTEKHPMPLRRFDPTCRLRGYQTLAARIDELRAELQSRGIDPVLAATNWNMPGILGLYCQGHPELFCLGLAMGERRSQYDFWRPNPVWDREAFLGRTFVIVGGLTPEIAAAFTSLEPTREIVYREADQTVAVWHATVARGFKGFAPVEELLKAGKY